MHNTHTIYVHNRDHVRKRKASGVNLYLTWQSLNLFQLANWTLFIRQCLSIGTIIGTSTCTSHGTGLDTCPLPEWDTDVLDSLKNLVIIHDIIAGIWVLVCVQWKILNPLRKYLDMTSPVFEGELLKNNTPSPRLMRIPLVQNSTSAKFGKNPQIFT